MKRSFLHHSKEGFPIHLDLYAGEGFASQPILLYVHGFKGFKDWGFVPYIGEYFARQGITFLAFNFSHNGIGPDLLNFTEFDRFEANTYSREISEVSEVVHLCQHTDIFGAYLKGKIALLGHSRGGGIALLSAVQNPAVAAVITWASVSTLDRFSKTEKQVWRQQGYIERVNSRTGQVFRLGIPLLEEIERHGKKRLNVLQAVQNLNRPLLIFHGQNDESVPPFEGEQLNVYGTPELTEFRLIPKTGHTFGTKHPFVGSTDALEQLLLGSTAFLQEHL